MWDELYECRWSLLALIFLIGFGIFAYAEGQKDRAAFFGEHKCRDVPMGYVCADGAKFGG